MMQIFTTHPNEWLTNRQLLKYAVVGILNNALGYILYLLLTSLWLTPRIAASIIYPVAAAIGFFAHSNYTFNFRDYKLIGIIRYISAHCIAYTTNIAMLYLLVDLLGYPHQAVQIISIIIVAVILFILFKYFVFL